MKFTNILIQTFFFTAIVAIASATVDDDFLSTDIDALFADDMLSDIECNDEGKYFSNIDWLLKGYNLMKGNPNHPTLDPGYALSTSIFDAPYQKQRRTGDCKYRVPDFMRFTPHTSCRKDMHTRTTKNSMELSTLLETKAKVGGGGSGGGAKAMFTASAGENKRGFVFLHGSASTFPKKLIIFAFPFSNFSPGVHASSKLFLEDAAVITNTEAWCTGELRETIFVISPWLHSIHY